MMLAPKRATEGHRWPEKKQMVGAASSAKKAK
jgi:hypothetical protein